MCKLMIFKFNHEFHQKKMYEYEFSNFFMRNDNGLNYFLIKMSICVSLYVFRIPTD